MKTFHSNLLRVVALTAAIGACGNDGSRNEGGIVVPITVSDDVIALIHAIDAGDARKLRGLLEAGAAPTPRGSPLSPLHAAITHFSGGELMCDYAALKILLDFGADPDFVDAHSGFSAMEDALSMGEMDCAVLLKKAGASLEKRGHSGQSILQFAVKGAERTGNTNVLKLVLSWGVDPNVRSTGVGYTALHEAAWVNAERATIAEAIVIDLLKSGTDPCLPNERSETALDIATSLKKSPPSVRKLLSDAMQKCGSS